MSFLWEGLKVTAQMAGNAAMVAGQKTKLSAEMMLVDREIADRKRQFGVELYDYVAPLASNPDFFAANDKMTDTVRGPMLGAQREIAALMIKRTKLKENLAQAEVTRKAAFPAPATTAAEKIFNTGKAASYAANETKIVTEISMVDTQIKAHKQDFGLAMFDEFVRLEDKEGWLPTVRDIRSMYDTARREVDKLLRKKEAKEKEIKELDGGGSYNGEDGGGATPPRSKSTTRSDADTSAGAGGLWGMGSGAASAGTSTAPAVNPVAPISSTSQTATTSYGATGGASTTAAVATASNGLFGYPSSTTTNSINAAASATAASSAVSSAASELFAYPGASSTTTAPVAVAPVSAPAPYDPFSAPVSTVQSSAPAHDPFSSFQTQQPVATYDPFSQTTAVPTTYDPFSSTPAPTANSTPVFGTGSTSDHSRTATSDDPFAGL